MVSRAVFIVMAAIWASGCGAESGAPDPDPGSGGTSAPTLDAQVGSMPGDEDLGYDPGTGPDPSTGPSCGAHGVDDGTQCACEAGYVWCNEDPQNLDCCPDTGSSAKPPLAPEDVTGLTVLGAKIRPFKFIDGDGQPVPWDWDGNVPDWMLNAVGLLARVFPELQFWNEVLQKVDEYAPFLLEGTTPPDPYIRFSDSPGDSPVYYATSSYNADALEPTWNDAYVPLSAFAGAEFVNVEVWDEDAVFDDFMGQFQVAVDVILGLSPDGLWGAIDGVPTLFAIELAAY